tara:strand:+ start:172 stop:312 length:141 start_codon:yes stop_codon:yes gene_type:complete
VRKHPKKMKGSVQDGAVHDEEEGVEVEGGTPVRGLRRPLLVLKHSL